MEKIKEKEQTLMMEDQVQQIDKESEQQICSQSQETAVDTTSNEQSTKKEEKSGENEEILGALSDFANLLSTTVQDLKEEFYLTQVSKIMSKLQKVIVRYDITEKELSNLFKRAGYYGLGGITVAPAYLMSCIKQNKKNITGKLNINCLVDFPFGESSLKGKVANIKESIKSGSSSVAVSVPSMLLSKDNLKQLKKECKKYYSASRKNAGIVLNASDVNKENFSEAIKALRKTKISYIVLAFGEATMEEVKVKLETVAKSGTDKKLYVLANVENVESVVELFKMNVDSVLTPYADDIGNDLLKRFNLIVK